MSQMLQIGLLPNCSNTCQFCLRKNYGENYTIEECLSRIDGVIANLDHIDWKDRFSDGISILGGEVYFITDQRYQDAFMKLIDAIIDKVLLVSPNSNVRYSTVTNGLYDPALLFKSIDRIVERVGIKAVDVNFSYDLKYRFANERRAMLALSNINAFHNRYNYCVGVQMILTQHLIDSIMKGKFDIKEFEDKFIPGNLLAFLYPHPLNEALEPLPDFQFTRESLFKFADYCVNYPIHWHNFVSSCKNSATYKATGMKEPNGPIDQQPVMTDGKEIINPECGHSVLYQCYSDSDKCMLCDLEGIE